MLFPPMRRPDPEIALRQIQSYAREAMISAAEERVRI